MVPEANNLAEIKERDFHAKQAQRRRAGADDNRGFMAQAVRRSPRRDDQQGGRGVGGWLTIAAFVALAIYVSAGGRRGRGIGGAIAPHAQSVEELEMLLEFDKLLARDFSGLAPRSKKRRSTSPHPHCSASSCAVGTQVTLTPDFHEYADAKRGPLQEGDEGVVIDIDTRVQVEAPSGETWWYSKRAIVSAAERPKSHPVYPDDPPLPKFEDPSYVPSESEYRYEAADGYKGREPGVRKVEGASGPTSPPIYLAATLAVVASAAGVFIYRIKQQQARAAAAYEAREQERIKELAEYRRKEVQKMRDARLAREAAAAAAAAAQARSRDAAVAIQRAWWERKERQRQTAFADGFEQRVQQLQHEINETAEERAAWLRYVGRRSAQTAVTVAEDGDPYSPDRYVPGKRAGGPVTIGLWEDADVSGPADQQATGTAHLDTGNAALTVMTRRFAESVGLVGADGLPFMVSPDAVDYITAGGIVAGATTRQAVVPSVTFAIGGVEVTSRVAIAEEAGLGVREHRWDLLVCMDDIRELEKGGAQFRPCAD